MSDSIAAPPAPPAPPGPPSPTPAPLPGSPSAAPTSPAASGTDGSGTTAPLDAATPDGASAPSSDRSPAVEGTPTGATPDVGAGGRAQQAAESETLTEHGIQLCRTARWRAAIEPLRRATELDPQNFAAFYYLGDAYNHADSLPAALEAFEAAARLRPDHWRALKGVGIVLDRMRRPQEAAAAYQRARDAQSKTASR